MESQPADRFHLQLRFWLPQLKADTSAPQPFNTTASPTPVPPAPSPALVSPTPNYSGYQAHRITTCGGQPSNANFRQFPSLSPNAILGGVAYNDIVYLTARTTYGDGVAWHEAIAPSLFPVPDPGAINNTQPNQVGWIARCFVSG